MEQQVEERRKGTCKYNHISIKIARCEKEITLQLSDDQGK